MARGKLKFIYSGLMLAWMVLLLGGCSLSGFGTRLGETVLNQDDPELVRSGAPAYLLLIDTLIADNPDDEDWLCLGANLYSVYAAAFVDDPQRARRLSGRAFDYGCRALCAVEDDFCGLTERPYKEFVTRLQDLDEDELPQLFALTVSWLGWAQAHSQDMTALTALPRLELALKRIVELDEGYAGGSAWHYLGILYSLRPPSLGGQPEQARVCFEQALHLSRERNLGVKVDYARYYARLLYDRELHDRLLYDVLQADPHAPGLTLMNILSQQQARCLLDSAADYF
ncbi:MAG: hypothetical protein JXR59_07430 [Desulfuromonadaceae bacterium]|nr:hypothetical protein [Desulfuromonadaceae bacterium]